MRILGIDPGTITMGYGIIDSRDDEVTVIDYGALTAPTRSPIADRLSYLYKGLLKIISRCHPDCVAIERPFVAKNAQAALAIGRAQAVAILAAANKNIPSFEYMGTGKAACLQLWSQQQGANSADGSLPAWTI